MELRTCGLGAVVSVLLGVGVGFGWHSFADGVGVTAVASSAQREAPSPLLSCPPGPRGGGVPDVPVLPHANNQPDITNARGTTRVAHAAHAGRAGQVASPYRRDGSERNAF
jgi:hypothetical protein